MYTKKPVKYPQFYLKNKKGTLCQNNLTGGGTLAHVHLANVLFNTQL